jgi:serine/threonine protein kinase
MSAPDPVRPGTIIDGRYELMSMLGSGGFGQVYKARQLTTQQLVAVKIARRFDGPAESGAVARFKREMAVVAELSHPNIVRLIDSGQLPDGRLFAVLQLVRGVSLAELLKAEGPLEPHETKHLMMQVLDALCSAHDLGVIHRDLKPANIMVTSVGALRNAMVLDFGIATFTKAMRDESYQSLTPEGSVGGTPAYMAPEQLHGKEPNPQTDIYAWGLVFIGFTPDLVCGVWMGRDDFTPIGAMATGGSAALPIWVEFMDAAHARIPPRAFDPPEDIWFVRADEQSGHLAPPGARRAEWVPMIRGTLPTRLGIQPRPFGDVRQSPFQPRP